MVTHDKKYKINNYLKISLINKMNDYSKKNKISKGKILDIAVALFFEKVEAEEGQHNAE